MLGGYSGRAVAALVLALCALLPTAALGADDEEGSATIFGLRASHGYRVIVFGHADRDDGRGEVSLYLIDKGKHHIVFYAKDGYVTDTRLKASFGALGGMDLVLRPSGKQGTVRAGGACDGKPEPYEKATYRGIFEFRGEEGFAYARATSISVSPQPFIDLICSYYLEVSPDRTGGPGAALTAQIRRGRHGIALEVAKNRPDGRTLVTASAREKRHGVEIVRAAQLFAGSAAFEYRESRSAARLDLPAPFSGSAVFRRGVRGARRWTGDLKVDLPGRADVSLTRPGLSTTLVPATWSYEPPEFR